MKSIVMAVAAVVLSVSTVQARQHHHHVGGHEAGHSNHITLNVMPSAAGQFAGLVSDFKAMGYAIGTPGCLSSGHMRNSKHHFGGACDLFNQIARNRTALPQPPCSVQDAVARRHGLISGCIWRNPDGGHFEVPTHEGRHAVHARRMNWTGV